MKTTLDISEPLLKKARKHDDGQDVLLRALHRLQVGG